MTQAGSTSNERVRELVATCLDRMQTEGIDAVARVCAAEPELEPLVRRRIEKLQSLGFTSVEETRPDRLGDFKLEERIGGGGMGIVYRARQESLQRDVAVKVVRGDQMFFPEVRERFRREIESVARLSHPGIVAIHTVGEQNGVPFFAMEIVAGITLQQLVQELALHDPRTLSARHVALVLEAHGHGPLAAEQAERVLGRSWVEVAFRIMLQAARALQHAHEREVLHRDIKPSNLMLTAEGRVVLLDFGLASIEGQSRLTQAGVEVGSLAYQPPEVAGGGAAPGPGADVYALGVTLYELLTLRSPFVGRNGNETRANVLAGAPPRIAARNPAVPWDAETVCMAALDRDPARRYASAAAFADDLAACLELRPIAARRAGLGLRSRRWVQRNPALAVSLGLLLLALVLVPSGIAVLEHRASLEIAEQSRRADAERRRAERNLRNARLAVDRMLATVGRSTLYEVPQMEPVRKKLLEDAREFYEHFLAENHGARELRRDFALTTQGLGSLLRKLGQVEKSQEALGRAVDLAEQLAREEPASLEARRDLWNCWNELGVTARERGDHELAAKAWSNARDAAVLVAAATPNDPRRLSDLCDSVQNLGTLHALEGSYDEAERELLAVLEVRNRVRELAPEELYPLNELAGLWNNLAFVCEKRRRFANAALCYENAMGLQREALRRGDSVDLRVDLARTLHNDARLVKGHKPEDAEAAFLEVVELRERITREFPSMPGNHLDLADTLGYLVEISSRRDPAEARGYCERALRAVEKADRIVSTARSLRLKQVFEGMLAKLGAQPATRSGGK